MPTQKLGQKGKILEGTEILTLVGARAIGGVGQSVSHNPVSLDATTHADDLLGLADQIITLDSQAANTVLAGPTSGGAAAPTMRALVAADLPAVSSSRPGYYGDGSDGDETISADTLMDVTIPHYDNLTIDAGKILKLQSTTLFVQDMLTINGTIRGWGNPGDDNDGANGGANSGATGGTGGGYGTPGDVSCIVSATQNQAGTAGGDAGQNGADGNNADWGFHDYGTVALDNAAQAGANGGNGAVGTGGTGGNGDGSLGLAPRNYVMAVSLGTNIAPTFFANPLSGGAAGGGGGTVKGGGGGGGAGGDGGNIVIIARHIVWGAAGAIVATGGNGGNGGASDGDGGGGGGGSGGNGGIVILCFEDETGARNVDVSGGSGGTGGTSVSASAGANGPDGYDGVVIELT